MKYLLVLFLMSAQTAHAFDCSTSDPKTEEVAEYLGKMAESLNTIKAKFNRIEDLSSKKDKDLTDIFVAFKELKGSYSCASEMISGYKVSKNENIAKSAQSLSQTYQDLTAQTESSIQEMKLELDGKLEQSTAEIADKRADKMIEIKKKWEIVILSIGLGTMSSLGKENPKTKKIDNLIITRKERDAIVKTLKSEFKLPLGKGDQSGIDVAAENYYEFLKQDWKFKMGAMKKTK